VVCRWNERGFGFIKPIDGTEEQELWVHVSCITDGNKLEAGDEVEYKSRYDERRSKDVVEVWAPPLSPTCAPLST